MEEQSQERGRFARLMDLAGRSLDRRPIDRALLLCGILTGALLVVLAAMLRLPYSRVAHLLNTAAIEPAQCAAALGALVMGVLYLIGRRLRRRHAKVFWFEVTLVELYNIIVITAFYFTGFYATNGTVAFALGLIVALPLLDLRALTYGVWTYLVLLPGVYLLENFNVIPQAPLYNEFPKFSNPELQLVVETGRIGGTWILLLLIWIVMSQVFSRWQQREAEFRELSQTDSLTGVMNRRHFFESYEKECVRARRLDRPLSMLMCDIDHFKDVNDTWGHATGDDVLFMVARTMEEGLRGGVDLLARFGGEEFIVLLPETDGEGARVVAERIRERVGSLVFRAQGTDFSISISLGVATVRGEFDADTVLELADQHLYRAKKNGRNRVEG